MLNSDWPRCSTGYYKGHVHKTTLNNNSIAALLVVLVESETSDAVKGAKPSVTFHYVIILFQSPGERFIPPNL